MALLQSCTGISKNFGSRTLFSGITLGISEGERLGLIGPNGAGKSTLLKILAGKLEPDEGSLNSRRNLRAGYVPQQSDFPPDQTIYQTVAHALPPSTDEGELGSRVALALGRAGFTDGSAEAGSLSGGWRRRLSIARELVLDPDLLFLDEPTNHLDLEGILWLEKLLAQAPFASVVVSHDRYFLDNVVSGMIEINRIYDGGIIRIEGSYSDFLEKKEAFIEAQSSRQESLANKVRREVEWLRRGAKARTGKSRARTDEAGRLIDELSDLETRSTRGVTQIDFSATERRTKRLVSVEAVSKDLGGRTLFRNLNLTLGPGTRLGILGRNGTGKTTFLRMLAGELEADSGRIERAGALRIVYFDQTRQQLDPNELLRSALGAHGDHVIFRDRSTHIAGWAKRFLFDAGQLDRPMSSFSGGEQARVLIARLMLQPADLLLLDEPANDLDIPTLEILEESLVDFPGALALVTHDRFLLDRVSTAILGLDGQGAATIYSDYWQWEQAQTAPKPATPKPAVSAASASQGTAKKKLSYLEAREFEGMEQRILEAEQATEAVRAEMHSPEVVSDGPRLQSCYERLQAAEATVEKLYARWSELEGKQQ